MKQLLLMFLAFSLTTFAQVRLGGNATGAGSLAQDLTVQVAQQGVKLDTMDTNINRRLDDLVRKMDDMGKTTNGLKTDIAKLGVFSSIFTFGLSSIATVLLSVFLAVPLTFAVQHILKKRFVGGGS